ncbi:hypothetical protein QAD02_013173 [Eretmocerus hayati]|uniref:Uncharacterized protein n=1 Tax=Eretmocerus hayati TaxID=131215 RepID=A0ACC2P2U8_9HYME|nr:hypothetical protein QAD02_013173 [Eretmocerus hayati]
MVSNSQVTFLAWTCTICLVYVPQSNPYLQRISKMPDTFLFGILFAPLDHALCFEAYSGKMSKPNLSPVQRPSHTLNTGFAVVEFSEGTPFFEESEKLFAVALRHYNRDEETVRLPKGSCRPRDFGLIEGLLSEADVDLPTQ